MSLRVIPISLHQANEIISRIHRHHKATRGHRFSLGVIDSDGTLRGVLVASRPVARMTSPYGVLEVSRVATDGTKNACSILYAAAARAAKAMGYERIQTFILDEEPGTSLKASGWTADIVSAGGEWSREDRDRSDDHPLQPKQRWVKNLNPPIERAMNELPLFLGGAE